jgi:hypothetical protein
VPSDRCSIEEQYIEYCGYSIDYYSVEHLSEGTKTLLDDGNVMPKHVGATIHN